MIPQKLFVDIEALAKHVGRGRDSLFAHLGRVVRWARFTMGRACV
jgi:hypothetical protein